MNAKSDARSRRLPLIGPCRFNRKTRNVELKSSKHTEDASALQKTADFIQAFMLGFEVQVGGVELCQ